MDGNGRRRLGIAVLGLCLIAAIGGPARASDANQPLVFAHYMVCFTLDLEWCKREIRIARQAGLDGFALDFGEWGGWNAKEKRFEPTRYVPNAEVMFEAARQIGPDFKLLLTPEYSVQPVEQNVRDMVRRFYKHPNVLRRDGNMVLSSYGAGGNYLPILNDLRKEGYKVSFLPFTGLGRFEMSLSFASALRMLTENPQFLGIWRFICDDSPRGMLLHNANAARACQWLGKLYMAGIAFNYYSANVRDLRGVAGYGAVWEGIIRDGADWVEIVTWNDYNEDTNLMHYKWKRGWSRPLYNRDGSYLDATRYYVQWFKTKQPPTITQDKVYFAYRDRSRWLSKMWDPKAGQWVDMLYKQYPFDQYHDDVLDRVYVTTFLTAPAELTVELGGKVKTFKQPAGVALAELPMRPGVPHIVLRRGGEKLVDVVGRRSIVREATRENAKAYEKRGLARLWAGAAAAGKAKRLEAESGKLTEGAKVVSAGGRKGVRNARTHGSGFTVPAGGLKPGMYNVRVIYSHQDPNGMDARLTLVAEGFAPHGKGPEPYYIPVWLPPTREGKFATASFFWTLFEDVNGLSLNWYAGSDMISRQPPKTPKPEWSDHGTPIVDAIELVAVDPAQATPARTQPWPMMVALPGGKFVMGGKGGEPDELPAHNVKLSPFAIARCEVTNAEYERFDPGHRRYRDGYSWRSGEPVIYVCWADAARYCDWLSKQAGLKPYYGMDLSSRSRDDQAKIDPTADGFRLPTEAQWEYAATGRGEGRKYPWGNGPPVAGKQGNFELDKSLSIDPRLQAQQAQGVVVVGSFPAGASRDGVMDLAGNVAEWCDDWYHPYTADGQTDPDIQKESHSRVIRGGSWGYYGHSQRSRDREFNSQKYPGYIYVGFRVALPEAGLKKLRARR